MLSHCKEKLINFKIIAVLIISFFTLFYVGALNIILTNMLAILEGTLRRMVIVYGGKKTINKRE